MQRYGFKPSDDGRFSKFQEWDEGDFCLYTESLGEIYSIKQKFDAEIAHLVLVADGMRKTANESYAAMKASHEWENNHMQDLRNECFKILEALATDGNFPCGDNDLVEAPSRAIKQITALEKHLEGAWELLRATPREEIAVLHERIKELTKALSALYEHTKNNRQIVGLNEKIRKVLGVYHP